MRLVRLHLLNFRQHAESELDFRGGLTGIIGPNGAGKSTILEAIAWAIYGSSAARGTNDTIRFFRAPGRSRVQVDLIFELAGHEYRVSRTLHNAEVFVDSSATPVATTIGGATEYLQARLGMTREEFFNTYFTGQKELQFLAQMGSAQRGRFLGQVLGYERLRLAQERARGRRNELRHEIEGLRAGLPDPDVLRAARQLAERRNRDARTAVGSTGAAFRDVESRHAELTPKWEAAQQARDQARELMHAQDVATRDLQNARDMAARAQVELTALAQAESELVDLRKSLAVLPDVSEECERLAKLAQQMERRRALEERERALAAEVLQGERRLEKLQTAPQLAEQSRTELEEARTVLVALEETVDRLHADWVRDRQEVETTLRTYRDRAQELKEHIDQLRQAGPDGTCPTCERPLREQFDSVMARLDDEWQSLVQDGKYYNKRNKQLVEKPEDLVAEETRRAELRQALEEKNQRLARCERAVGELEQLRADQSRRTAELQGLRAELAEMPSDYDAAKHKQAQARLEELRGLERRASGLEQRIADRARREAELREAEARAGSSEGRIRAVAAQIATLSYSEEAFAQIREAFETSAELVRRAEIRAAEAP